MIASDPVAVQRFVDAATAGDAAEARRVVRLTLDRVGPIGVIEHLLAPAQIHIGDQWLAAAVDSADEHRVSAAVDEALDHLEPSVDTGPGGPALSVSTGVGDWHATPARMAVHRLRVVGWHARFVGVSFDATRLAQARELGVIDAVALSCVAAPQLLGVIRAIRVAHAAGLPVVVGGRAFSAEPTRARRVGADAGPDIASPPVVRDGSWPVARSWEARPPSADARLDAVLALDLGIVTRQLQDVLGDVPIATDDHLATVLLRPSVDAWASAVAVDEPGIVTEQFAWSRRYLEARDGSSAQVGSLAAGLRAVVPIDPDDVLRIAAS